MISYTFHANSRCTTEPHAPAGNMIDAGIVAEPIRISDRDLRELSGEQLAFLEQHAFAPGFEVSRIEGGPWPEIEIRWKRPCVTTLPARVR